MNRGFQSLLFSLICAAGIGFILPSGIAGGIELLGIVGLIAGILIPLPGEEQPLLARLRIALFLSSAGLILFSAFVGPGTVWGTWGVWISVVCLFTTLSGSLLDLSGSLERWQLSLVLYVVSALGIGMGYLAQLSLA